MGSKLPSVPAVLPLLIRLLAAFVALSIPIAAINKTLYSWHPTFMALGFLGFMTEAILTSISFRTLEGGARTSAIQRHMLWQLASVTCVLLGFVAIEANKFLSDPPKPHFGSLHSKIGFATVFVCYAAALGGIVSFRKLGFLTRLPDRWQGTVKTAHRYVGMITWLLGLTAAELMMTHESIDKGAALQWCWRGSIAVLGALMLAMAVREPHEVHDKYGSLEADIQLGRVQTQQQQEPDP